jgi:hypothetical protein
MVQLVSGSEPEASAGAVAAVVWLVGAGAAGAVVVGVEVGARVASGGLDGTADGTVAVETAGFEAAGWSSGASRLLSVSRLHLTAQPRLKVQRNPSVRLWIHPVSGQYCERRRRPGRRR